MIHIPRPLIIALSCLFAAFLGVTAVFSIFQAAVDRPVFVVTAVVLDVVGLLAVLIPGRKLLAPLWSASVAFGITLAMLILISAGVDPEKSVVANHANWYVGGIGILMAAVAVRRRPLFAWSGIVGLVVHTIFWAGPIALVSYGVTGAAAGVAGAHLLTVALAAADRESERYSLAAREAAQWKAAQEARVSERQQRIAATSRAALPLLQRIVEAGGQLSPEERIAAIRLEAALRDEIRGRLLVNDAVRDAVRRARDRGIEVALLDEGGIDDLDEEELARVHAEIAAAIETADADRVVVRTGDEGSDVAVTIAGVRTSSESDRALGRDSDEEIALWLEIPRSAAAGIRPQETCRGSGHDDADSDAHDSGGSRAPRSTPTQ